MDESHRLRQMAQHKPLARSHREPPSAALQGQSINPNYVPSGHGGAVSTVQWFNTDTGAFISTDKSGQILIWDTNQFVPVTTLRLPGSIRCATMAKAGVGGGGTSHTLLAVGIAKSPSGQDRSVRLCDLRSGSTSHELVGHGPRVGSMPCVFRRSMTCISAVEGMMPRSGFGIFARVAAVRAWPCWIGRQWPAAITINTLRGQGMAMPPQKEEASQEVGSERLLNGRATPRSKCRRSCQFPLLHNRRRNIGEHGPRPTCYGVERRAIDWEILRFAHKLHWSRPIEPSPH